MKNLSPIVKASLRKLAKVYRNIFVTTLFVIFSAVANNGLYAADYFWVGNTGNWSDFAAHWATTSGGVVFHTSVPGPADDVYFDAGSFLLTAEVVTIDVPSNCNSMDWTGAANNPDLAGFSNLDIYGALTFIPAMTATYSGWIAFRSSNPGNTIDFSTAILSIGGIDFNGGGEWTIMSDVDLTLGFGGMQIIKGTLNTNGFTLDVSGLQSFGTETREMNLGNSTINCMMLWLDPLNLTFNAGTSTINIENNWFDGRGFTYYDVNFPLAWPADVFMAGSNTFHVLGLSDAYVTGVVFAAGDMNTVFDITFGATCSNRKSVTSDIPGQTALIKKISGTVQEDYLNIRDMEIIGGASFITDFGVDMGNVTNWTINTTPPGDFYWVGGTGNWSDPTHWGTFSGEPFPTSNTCIPTDANNVIFDANSFTGTGEVVTIDVIAFCNSMDWTGVTNTPDMASMWPGELNIYSSLVLDASMTASSFAMMYFRSNNSGNTITTAGQILNTSIYFEGTGDWTLQDNLTCNSIVLNQGYLNTNNNDINSGSFNSGTALNRQLDLGSSIVTLTSNWSISDNTNMTLNSGTSEIATSGWAFEGADLAYNNVILNNLNTTDLYGSNTFNELTLGSGIALYIEEGQTQVLSDLLATGTCSDLISIKSAIDGITTTISKATGSITIDYVSIQDITATGGATFNAVNSIDLGNTSGWTYTLLPSIDYYWNTNSGDWGDASHWSLTSGGAPNAGGCIPTQLDNVFFDGNSFSAGSQTVTLDQNAYCNNMDWTGVSNNPRFSGSRQLNIYGSLTFSPAQSTIDFYTGNTYFKSNNTGNTITSASKTFNGDVFFDGAGEWTLQDNFATETSTFNSVYLNEGSLISNNNGMDGYYFYSSTGLTRQLTLGSSTLNFVEWEFWDGTNLTVIPGTSTINLTNGFYAGGSQPYNDVNIATTAVAYIYGENSYNNLTISTASTILFEGGMTQTFNSITMPAGTGCADYFDIGTINPGIPAAWSMPAGTFNGDWLRITDLTAGGGGTFNATNSLGIGAVTGWNITSPPSVNLYWVGDGGNWSDVAHWSLTSGGAPSGCVPTINDSVFFDANSFTTPIQDAHVDITAYCKNMDWTGVTNTPDFAGGGQLYIAGSLTLVPGMTTSIFSVINFMSSGSGNTVITSGHMLSGLMFSGSGTYTLQDAVTLSWGGIRFNNGILNTNNQSILMPNGDFTSNSSSTRTLNLGSSIITLQNWQIIDATNMTLNPATSTIIMNGNGWEFLGGNLAYNDLTINPYAWGPIYFYDSNTFNTFTIAAGAEVYFDTSTTQTTTELIATGASGSMITIKTTNDGTTAGLSQASVFCGDYLNIQDLNASGATFYAGQYSVDMGNNTGWTFTGVEANYQYPAAMCEDVAGGGTVAGIDLTALESAIDGSNGYTHTWYSDAALTILVPVPTNVTVSNGQIFYDNVANGTCTNVAEVAYSVNPRPVLSYPSSNNLVCNGICDGDATILAAGATAPYTYLWNDPGAQTTTMATGLCAAQFITTVTDANGCVNSDTITLTQPTALALVMSKIDATCGNADGSAIVVVSGGTGPYTYLWDDPGTQTNSTATGVVAGTYEVMVTDNSGCLDSNSVVVNDIGAPSVSIILTIHVYCNGDSTGSMTVAASGGVAPYTYLWNDPDTQTNATATGLVAGSYNVTVSDNNSCSSNVGGSVSEPAALALTMDSVNLLINSVCTGQAIANILGGTPPYLFVWDDPGTQSTFTATGLCAGTYCIVFIDANGCSINDCVDVDEPAALVATITGSTNLLCNGVCTGDATVTTVGGVPPYTYGWDDPGTQTTAIATGLCGGAFNVLVTDANGATDTDAIIITEPVAALSSSISSSNNVTCNGFCDGDATASATGGTGAYTYLWDDPGTQTTAIATGLCNATFKVIVTDNNGCMDSSNVVITQPTALVVGIASFTNNLCNGDCNGDATLSISGGTGPYSILWDDPGTQTTLTATGLCAGSFDGIVTDANTCADTGAVVITQPAALTSSITASNNASCNGICDGDATVTPVGGVGPYTYTWTTFPTQTNAMAVTLCAGSYDVEVEDANACIDSSNVVITEPTAIVLITASVDATCGVPNGEASVSATGGVGPYTYIWDDPGTQTTDTATGLAANPYSVTVTDNSGCFESTGESVNDAGAGTASISASSNVTCNAGSDGTATVSITGGTAPFTYSWDDPGTQTTTTATGLVAATYTATVTDSNGCVSSDFVTITEPGAFVFSISTTDPSCVGACDGDANVSTLGSTPPYTYLWDDPGTQTDSLAIGLCMGAYMVIVTDVNGCMDSSSTTLSDPTPLVASITGSTDLICNGICDGDATVSGAGGSGAHTYTWDDPGSQTTATATGLCAVTFVATVTDNNGCTDTASVTITQPGAIILVMGSANATCGNSDGKAIAAPSGGTGPYTYAWDDPGTQSTDTATALASGGYNVTVTDNNGCTANGSVSVNDVGAAVVSISSTTDVSCFGGNDGSATLSASGGTPPLTYSWDDPDSQTDTTATGLYAGTYNVTVTDSVGCVSSAIATINEPATLGLPTSSTSATCNGDCDGSATLMASGGTSPYTYAWDGPGAQTNAAATGLCMGTYQVVIMDANGCADSTSVSVSEPAILSATTTTSDVTTCGVCNGSVSATPAGGTSPYGYLWNSGDTTSGLSGICAGIYSVTTTDNNGCQTVNTDTVNAPGGLLASISSFTDATCNALCDGDATVTSSGGTGPFTYSWDDPGTQSTATATGLCAGAYMATVEDALGCTSVSSITISEPAALTSSITSNDASCNGVCDGSATLTAGGGTSPYTYSWDDPGTQTTAMATGLCANSFIGTVTDSNGCSTTSSATIGEPGGMTLSTTADSVLLGSCTGTASVTATGGAAPLTYLWDDPGTQTTAAATGLCAGTYNVVVTDASGCSSNSSAIVNTIPDAIATLSEDFMFDVFPSLTDGLIHIDLVQTQAADFDIEVHNMIGKLMLTRNYREVKTLQTQLDLGALPNGVYIIRCTTDSAVVNKRIVISR